LIYQNKVKKRSLTRAPTIEGTQRIQLTCPLCLFIDRVWHKLSQRVNDNSRPKSVPYVFSLTNIYSVHSCLASWQ